MIEGLPLGWTDIGATGLLVLVVVMIFTGRLVPKRYYDREVQRGDALQVTVNSLTDQLRELTTDKDLALHMLSSVRHRADMAGGDDT